MKKLRNISRSNSNRERRVSLPKPGPESIVRRHSSSEPPDHRRVHFQVQQYFRQTYGGSKTESEMEFIETLNNSERFSFRLIIELLLVAWYMVVVNLYNKTSSDAVFLEVSCKIPELEQHFNFSALLNISVKNCKPTYEDSLNCHYCTKDVRNYTALAIRNDYNYDSIMKEIKNEPRDPKQEYCNEFVIRKWKTSNKEELQKYYTQREEYNLYCYNNAWYLSVPIASHTGTAIACVIAGFVADIYGRRMSFIIFSSIHITGLVTILIPAKIFLVLGNFLVGFQFIASRILYIMFLETYSNKTVYWIGLFIHVYIPCATLLSILFRYLINHWKYMHSLNTCLALVFIFTMWYITESPKWLIFVGNRPKAYNVLKLRNPSIELTEGLNLASDKSLTFKKIRRQLWKPIFRKRLALCIFLYLAEMVSIHMGFEKTKEEYNKPVFFLFSATFESVFLIVACIGAIKYGRRGTLFILLSLLSGVDGLTFMMNHNVLNVSNYILDIITSCHFGIATTILLILRFYTVELYPTTCRASAAGITACSFTLMKLFLYHRSHWLQPSLKPLYYMPSFVATITCLLLLCFLPATNNDGLPDTSRDALYEKRSRA